MTETLPSIELALLLGMRHGLVPDHLAVVDGLTMRASARSAPWMGALFSLGHGCVMLAMVAAAGFASAWIQPGATMHALLGFIEWLPGCFLLGLALLNAWSLLGGGTLARSNPVSLLVRPEGKASPASAFGIGMLFAFGLEGVLHAVAWGGAATALGGDYLTVLKIAGVFVLGMTITDALDGYVTARIASTASAASVQSLRRKLGWPIVVLCAISGVQLLSSKLCDTCGLDEHWMGAMGMGMMMMTIAAYAVTMYSARARAPA